MAGLGSRLRAISSSAGLDVDRLIPLTKAQLDLLTEFYALPKRHIGLLKKDRKFISEAFKQDRLSVLENEFRSRFPAIQAEIEKSLKSGKLEQGGILTECVYAQTLANHFELDEFADYSLDPKWLTTNILELLSSYSLKPRYVYRNQNGSRLLIQAGGPAGIDSALISVIDVNVFTIEFKENLAKSSEADLPLYGEDGFLVRVPKFEKEWPHFLSMVDEQIYKKLNFFDHIGSNINDFSSESIKEAVNGNYAGKKFADVICTEDIDGFLTMIPANQADVWGKLTGEIRPSGRNHRKVWTPNRLKLDIESRGGVITGEIVRMPLSSIKAAAPRGGRGISRYKINSLFYVETKNFKIIEDEVEFLLKNVQHNKPTISAHMDFAGISFDEVRNYYVGTNE
jgi:hypothetical protein